MFDAPGWQVITLRLEDSGLSSEDNLTVIVEDPQNCGDGACSETEGVLGACPEDCPECGDSVCGAGEAGADSGSYCLEDCHVGDAEAGYDAGPGSVEPAPEEAWPPYLSDLLISIAAVAIIIVAALMLLKRSRRRKTGLRAP